MSYHDKVFWAIFAFLLGIIITSLAIQNQTSLFVFLFIIALFALSLSIAKVPYVFWCTLLILLGSIYYCVDHLNYQKKFTAPLNQTTPFQGQILSIEDKYYYQRVTLELEEGFSGRVIFNVASYSTLEYGDVIRLNGELQSIEGEAETFFQKEGVHAALKKPKNIEVLQKRSGAKIKTALFDFRAYIQKSITRNLESPHSNFVTGLLIGRSGGFSKEFLEQMRKTGTTHLIALSGYNVTILATYILEIMILVFSRRRAFYGALLGISLFVVMTGGQASVVRAAVMSGIALYAGQSSQIYKPRNAIVLTAAAMTLVNPKVLVFDVGFQLSFLALLGILYLKPTLEKHLRLSQEPGFFGWRENLITTTAAQIAVLPVILYIFGFFSVIAVVTNVLILSLTPYTMLYGVLIVTAGSISNYLAALVAAFFKPLAAYQIWVIEFFASHSAGISVSSFPFFIVITYYLALGIYVAIISKKYGLQST